MQYDDPDKIIEQGLEVEIAEACGRLVRVAKDPKLMKKYMASIETSKESPLFLTDTFLCSVLDSHHHVRNDAHMGAARSLAMCLSCAYRTLE